MCKKETFDIDLLRTSRTGDRKFIQPIRKTITPPTRIKKTSPGDNLPKKNLEQRLKLAAF